MTFRTLLAAAGLLACMVSHAQPVDTWSNVSPAPDDRYTNPKSKLYSGPNGWYNFGEVRAEVANAAKTTFSFKTGLQYLITPQAYVFASNGQLRTLMLDFGTDKPAPGAYEAAAKANAAQKKVVVSFADVSNNKLLAWKSADKAGIVVVSEVNGHRYFKARGLRLAPEGMHNTGDLKQPMTLGLEGAVVPD